MASYGIDFGTTNTAVVECLFRNNEMIPTFWGELNNHRLKPVELIGD